MGEKRFAKVGRAAAFFLGIALVLYPVLAEMSLKVAQLEAAVRTTDAADHEDFGATDRATFGAASGASVSEAFGEAEAYNEDLYRLQQTEAFHYKGAEAADETYLSLLPEPMGVLEIPAIGLMMPVGHGTAESTLQKEAGHFYGTSLPVGGPSTHAGIAGHTGLAGAKLFSDLTKVQEGDVFYIHVLNRHVRYRVRDVRVVEPPDADRYIQIEEGRDLVTLYTCTPYGINSHRLLVTGERDEEKETGVAPDAAEAALGEARRTLLGLIVSLTLMAFSVSAMSCRRSGLRTRTDG